MVLSTGIFCTTGNGVSATGLGVSAMVNGVSATWNGVLATRNGVSATGNGVSVTGLGVSATGNGVNNDLWSKRLSQATKWFFWDFCSHPPSKTKIYKIINCNMATLDRDY